MWSCAVTGVCSQPKHRAVSFTIARLSCIVLAKPTTDWLSVFYTVHDFMLCSGLRRHRLAMQCHCQPRLASQLVQSRRLWFRCTQWMSGYVRTVYARYVVRGARYCIIWHEQAHTCRFSYYLFIHLLSLINYVRIRLRSASCHPNIWHRHFNRNYWLQTLPIHNISWSLFELLTTQ